MSSTFRRWWRPPRRVADREEDRRVTFLELFYDLVYVVVISEIAHHLALHVGRRGLLESAFLFVLVWVAWVNGTMYHELHGHNDLRTRVFTFLQMFCVAGMAVFAHSAFSTGAVGFALCFAAYQLILTHLFWQTGIDPAHRPMSRPYALTFLLSATMFAASAFMPEAARLWLWFAAMALSVTLPLLQESRIPDDPVVRAEHELSMRITPPVVERFGLFTIIVLGEVIVGVVQGVAGHHALDWTVGATAALGMLVAIGLWWSYFDFVSQRQPVDRRGPTFAWLYLHVLATAGIAATGAAILNVVEGAGHDLPAAVRWLLVGSVALALASMAGLMPTLQKPEAQRPLYRTGVIVTLVSAAAVVATGFTPLAPIPLLAIIAALLLVPVAYGIKVWIKVFGAGEIPLQEAP